MITTSNPTAPATQTSEERARSSQQEQRDAAAARTGAEAVAEAVKRAADASVAAARTAHAASAEGDFIVSGTPGGRFTLRGNGFTGSGTVLLNGKQLETLEWSNEYIRGKLPSDARSGEIVVWIDQGTQKRAHLKI